MKLKKVIKLVGVFSFAFSAAVWATESQSTPKQLTPELEKKYVEYQKQIDDRLLTGQKISLSDFKKPANDLAKDIASQGLSDEDKELIRKIDEIENKPKDKEFLKSIATLRLVVFRDQSEDEKSNDIQNLIKVLKMVEDYREPELATLKDQPDELQKKARKGTYEDKISMDKLKVNTKWTNENETLKNEVIRKKAAKIAEKIQEMNEQPGLVAISKTEDFDDIILEMEKLQKNINSYNKEPDAWSTPSSPISIFHKIPLNEPVAKKKRRPKKKFKNKRLRKLKKK